MEIWLIVNGKRTGPYPDYEVRGRIEHGQMDADEKVWHEGLAEWTPVGELDLFRKNFGKDDHKAAPPALPKEYLKRASATAPKPNAYLARRFWARWADLSAYAALWWLGMYLSGRDIGLTIASSWLLLSMYIPWFVLEAWLIQRFGQTPGKWLMGLRVVNEDGTKLTLKFSIWRALRVLVTGIGFGWLPLSVLCQTMSWFTARWTGKPIWDFLGNHKVEAVEHSPFRILGLIFVYVAAVYLIGAVLGPYSEKNISKDSPNYNDVIEVGENWYFPVKN
jgi:uncharacterized RDD family membrane protein YckC